MAPRSFWARILPPLLATAAHQPKLRPAPPQELLARPNLAQMLWGDKQIQIALANSWRQPP